MFVIIPIIQVGYPITEYPSPKIMVGEMVVTTDWNGRIDYNRINYEHVTIRHLWNEHTILHLWNEHTVLHLWNWIQHRQYKTRHKQYTSKRYLSIKLFCTIHMPPLHKKRHGSYNAIWHTVSNMTVTNSHDILYYIPI